MKIIISSDQLILIQSTYMKKMLKQFEMKKCKLVSTFMKLEIANILISITNEADDVIVKWYQQLIESLMWSAVYTRFDLTYSVRVLSRYAHNLSQIHCALIKRLLRYVVDITNVDLKFNKQSNDDLIDYSDSDFADLKDKRYLIDKYVFMLTDETMLIYQSSNRLSLYHCARANIWSYEKQQKKLFESIAFFMSW
jgi:hypothetical protein